ncbi:hypothetical protein BU15DRAFT_55558 [Melanogaster broomeanus]|nr:hypothetical protein BU15DRAFT_55558 [Melanogaster broomeanus]
MKIQNETVHVFIIPTRSISDLLDLKGTGHAFSVDEAESLVGQLAINVAPDKTIGIGGFKSAHPGWLTLAPLPAQGLGSQPRQQVVVKRPFYRVYSNQVEKSGPYKIGRYALVDEMKKLFSEANVLFWAKALLQLTYIFIDRCIIASPTPPPFVIPEVRFVEAGLALSFAPGASKAGSKTGSARAAFLVEELIGGGDGEFVKFIHNMDPNPLQEDEYGYELSLFFAFTQHVQYVKTRGLAFISDYQGLHIYSALMMSTNKFANFDIFGEGNIETAVDKFEEEHICNHYCKWEGFQLTEFTKTSSRDLLG